jgi:hypothetical protein
VRFEVFKRDKFTCRYCGKRPPDVMLEVDHIQPVCDGGSDDPNNLTTACFACNRGKGGVALRELAPAIDEDELYTGIQEMLERSHSIRQSLAAATAHRKAMDRAVALIRTWWNESFDDDRYVQDRSIRQFLGTLSVQEIADAIAATEARDDRDHLYPSDRWKYFCGVCWTMVRSRKSGEGAGQ